MFELDFDDDKLKMELSYEDELFMTNMERGEYKQEKGHEMSLP